MKKTLNKFEYFLIEIVMFNIVGIRFYKDYLRFYRRKQTKNIE